MTFSPLLRRIGWMFGIVTAIGAGMPALAQQGGNQVAAFDHWGVYVSQSGSKKVCYALANPTKRDPENLKRDPGYIFVSIRPSEKVRDEVAFVMGFSVKETVTPVVSVGSEKYGLIAKGSNIWMKAAEEQTRLIASMAKGSTLSIAATSLRGNKTVDQYSLTGFAKAMERTRQECR